MSLLRWHDDKSSVCRLKPHKRCCQSSSLEPINAVKEPGELLKRTPHLCALQLPAFFCISLWSAGSEVPPEWPPWSRTIITLVCDPSRVAGKEMNSKLGLQGLEYYLVQTEPTCSSLLSFTSSHWCWQFPQMKLCQANTWSMALVAQILTSQSNLFPPTTQDSWCPCSIQRRGGILDAREKPLPLHPF